MGNTCGCVDQAEKDGEVKVENAKLMNQQNNNHRQAALTNYRDSTLSKNAFVGGQNTYDPNFMQYQQLFATDDPYLI